MPTSSYLHALRERLVPRESPLSLPQLALLGAVVGGLAGLAIAALHGLIEILTVAWVPLQQRLATSHEKLPLFITTAGGAVLLGLIYQLLAVRRRNGGFVHIIERLTYHQGQLPAANAWVQMLGTALATATHQAVGREGAAAHMGAAAGSWLARKLDLPTSSVRVLVGCGAAAGISASFNTPLAGVIFIMEVIVVEYSVASLAPCIIAAVTANAVAHMWLQSHPALVASTAGLESLHELWILVALGVLLGLVARVYLDASALATARMRHWPVWCAMTAAGVVTGLAALVIANVVDNGFEVINTALAGELTLGQSASLGGAILLCSALALAAGLPGGVIMPCMLGGACLGLVFGMAADTWLHIPISDPGVYALLGLGALLAAVLHAPLTALVLLVELSSRTEILLPAMLVVITALLTARRGRSSASVFALVLRHRGLDYRNDPVSQSLRRISVMAAMNRSFVECPEQLSVSDAHELLVNHPEWCIVVPEQGPRFALPAADLLRALNQARDDGTDETLISLSSIPGQRRRLGSVHLRASLQEAWDALRQNEVDALCVERPTHKNQITLYGILTREAIDNAYRA